MNEELESFEYRLQNFKKLVWISINSLDRNEKRESRQALFKMQKDLSNIPLFKLISSSEDQLLAFYGLEILQGLYIHFWTFLNKEEKQQQKDFVIGQVFNNLNARGIYKTNRLFQKKFYLLLVKIVLHPKDCTLVSFLNDLLKSFYLSDNVLNNNLQILYLTFEEMVNCSEYILQIQILMAGKSLFRILDESREIVQNELSSRICYFSMLGEDTALLLNTLKFTIRLLPHNYYFYFNVINLLSSLVYHAEVSIGFFNSLLELSNRFRVKNIFSSYRIQIFDLAMLVLQEIFPINKNSIEVFNLISNQSKELALNCANFMIDFIKEIDLFNDKNEDYKLLFFKAHFYFTKLGCLPGKHMLSVFIDYYYSVLVVKDWFFSQTTQMGKMRSSIIKLKKILMARMKKPEELLIIIGENGDLEKEVTYQTENQLFNDKMKFVSNKILEISPIESIDLILEKLSSLIDSKKSDYSGLDAISWIVGAISNNKIIEAEKKILVPFLKDLLFFCENTKMKKNKAYIAGNILYVVKIFPNFLTNHKKFFRTLLAKLFEFMKESYPGVRDMSVDTFCEVFISYPWNYESDIDSEDLLIITTIVEEFCHVFKVLKFRHKKQLVESLSNWFFFSRNHPSLGRLVLRIYLTINKTLDTTINNGFNVNKKRAIIKINRLLDLNLLMVKILKSSYSFIFGEDVEKFISFFKFISGKFPFGKQLDTERNGMNEIFLRKLKNNLITLIIEKITGDDGVKKFPFRTEKCNFFLLNILESSSILELGCVTDFIFFQQALEKILSTKINFERGYFISIIKKGIFQMILYERTSFNNPSNLKYGNLKILNLLINSFLGEILKLDEQDYFSEKYISVIIYYILDSIDDPDHKLSQLALKMILELTEKIIDTPFGEFYLLRFSYPILKKNVVSIFSGNYEGLYFLRSSIVFNIIGYMLNLHKIGEVKNLLKELLFNILPEKYFFSVDFIVNRISDSSNPETFEFELRKLVQEINFNLKNF